MGCNAVALGSRLVAQDTDVGAVEDVQGQKSGNSVSANVRRASCRMVVRL